MTGTQKIDHGKRFKLALVTGYSSTAVTVLITFLAVPTLAVSLSESQFSLYQALLVTTIFTSFGQLGAGPSLTRKVALANSDGDLGEARSDVQASYLVCGLAFLLCIIPLAILMLSGLFARSYGLSEGTGSERIGCALVAIVACCSIALSPTGRVLIGLHRVHVANNANVISNVLILVGLLILVPATHLGLIATSCFVVPGTLTAIALTIYSFRQTPELFLPIKIPPPESRKAAIHGSAAFVCFEISLVLLREGTKMLTGQKLGHHDLDKIGIAFFIASQAQSFFSTIVNPMMPMIIDFRKSGRLAEAKKAYFAAFGGAFGAICLGALLMAWKGTTVLLLWTHHRYEFTSPEAVGLEIMAGAYMLRILNGLMLFCLGRDWSAVSSTVAGCLLVASVLFFLTPALTSYLFVYGLIGLVIFGIIPFISIMKEIGVESKV